MIVRQIPVEQLKPNTWYVGRGRNANVALWTGDTFLTITVREHRWGGTTIKDEGYYGPESGCFQPFLEINEGTVLESVGLEPGWDRHYAKIMQFDAPLAQR